MFCEVNSAGISGICAYGVTAEIDVSGGLPAFNMVGRLSTEVREAKERVVRAIINSGFDLPARKITVNLSPANIRKHGTGFDVPIAVGILISLGLIRPDSVRGRMFIGELGLDGKINEVRGILPIAVMAAGCGIKELIVPSANVFEGDAQDRVILRGAASLSELVDSLNHGFKEAALGGRNNPSGEPLKEEVDFKDVSGQLKAKRATMVAAAGFHNLMYIGPLAPERA